MGFATQKLVLQKSTPRRREWRKANTRHGVEEGLPLARTRVPKRALLTRVLPLLKPCLVVQRRYPVLKCVDTTYLLTNHRVRE